MSKTGGHRGDSKDISFAIRPHRGGYLSPYWSLGPLNPFAASRDEPGRAAASAATRIKPNISPEVSPPERRIVIGASAPIHPRVDPAVRPDVPIRTDLLLFLAIAQRHLSVAQQ